VLAHAVAIRSDPAGVCPTTGVASSCNPDPVSLETAPAAVRVWFSEPVQPFGDGLIVTGPDGHRVDRGSVRISGLVLGVDVDATRDGLYVVRWQAVGEDTHPSRGRFVFWVGPPTPGVSLDADAESTIGDVAPFGLALQAVSRWLHFAGYALSFGVIAFQVLIARNPSSDSGYDHRLRRLVDAGIVMLLGAEPLALFGQTASIDPSQIVDPFAVSAAFDSNFGRAMSLRLGAILFLWVLLGFTSPGSARGGPVALALGVALAFVDGAAAHALSVRPAWAGLLVGAAHLMAAGVWIGGIAALLAIWRAPDVKAHQQTTAARFGRLALGSVLVLTVSGALTAWWHVGLADGGVGIAFSTDYGRALAVKVALTLAALAIVALLGRRFRPTVVRWWTAELVALAAVIAFAGLVVSLRPPA
jgi:copper transport protein